MICVGAGDHVKRAWRSGALCVMTKSLLIIQSSRGETAGESGRSDCHSKSVLRLFQKICSKKARMTAKGLDVTEDERRQGSG